MKKTIEANKIRKMQSELHMIDEANKIKNTHTFFTDSGDEDGDFDLAKRLNTHPSMLGRRTNRPRLEDLHKLNITDADIEVNLCRLSLILLSKVFFSIILMKYPI